jgi:glycosyltransferase 2 family protein
MTTRALPRGPTVRRGASEKSPVAKRRWAFGRRVLTGAFLLLVMWLLVHHARAIEWQEVGDALKAMPAGVLAMAAAFAVASHLLYSCFDLLGKRYTGHDISSARVMAVTFVSYAFNLNLGSLIGGVAFRYRLYSRLGLDHARITRVVTLSMLTNWFGYLLLAGLVFAFGELSLPPRWKIETDALPILGWGLLAVALSWLGLCLFSSRRQFSVRGHEIDLPSPRMALLQLTMSCTNWLLMAGAVYVLLQQQVSYPMVLGVLLLAAIAGVITHVPAGLGVLEAVFLALLAPQMPQTALLAGLLGYRALYYLLPLLAAVLLYVGLEAQARRARG